jgi:hypothetical protein
LLMIDFPSHQYYPLRVLLYTSLSIFHASLCRRADIRIQACSIKSHKLSAMGNFIDG